MEAAGSAGGGDGARRCEGGRVDSPRPAAPWEGRSKRRGGGGEIEGRAPRAGRERSKLRAPVVRTDRGRQRYGKGRRKEGKGGEAEPRAGHGHGAGGSVRKGKKEKGDEKTSGARQWREARARMKATRREAAQTREGVGTGKGCIGNGVEKSAGMAVWETRGAGAGPRSGENDQLKRGRESGKERERERGRELSGVAGGARCDEWAEQRWRFPKMRRGGERKTEPRGVAGWRAERRRGEQAQSGERGADGGRERRDDEAERGNPPDGSGALRLARPATTGSAVGRTVGRWA